MFLRSEISNKLKRLLENLAPILCQRMISLYIKEGPQN